MDQVTGLLKLLSGTINGQPYYGPSASDALRDVDAATASSRPAGGAHSIWEIVAHVASELRYSASLLEGSAGAWVAGETTWPKVFDASPSAWDDALKELSAAHDALATQISVRDPSSLGDQIPRLAFSFAEIIVGSAQHVAYHMGQVMVLKRQAHE